ncbi:hypothetical protein VPH35_110237 [Triticum aestivum]
MKDPGMALTGITYDRESVERWLVRGCGTCPITGSPVWLADLDWCVANRAERVPTPKVPVAEADAAEVLAARRGNVATRGHDRSRRCLAAAGAARQLASAFQSLAGELVEGTSAAVLGALGKILAALTVLCPLDDEARHCIASPASAARASAAIVLRELASSADQHTVDVISRMPGVCSALVGLVRNPVSPQATKVALVTDYYLVSGSYRAAASFAELGTVFVVVELLVDAIKGTSEKALVVLDGVLCADTGLESTRAHALVVPLLVKKMFRVSHMATEFAVSALWRLCRAALRVGVFQKLLQVGCGGVTKGRASELLKLLNGFRGNVECIETVDFKGLKRPFLIGKILFLPL